MLERLIKPTYKKVFIDSVLTLAMVRRLQPNAITLVSLLFGVAVLPLLYFQQVWLATMALIISGYCDSLDGAVARATSRSTPLGTVYDIVADRIVEVSAVLGLCAISPDARGAYCALMLASIIICISSFLVVGIFTPNASEKSFHYSPGLMERLEAFAFFIAMMWLPQFFAILAIVFSVLVLFTGLNRVREFATQN